MSILPSLDMSAATGTFSSFQSNDLYNIIRSILMKASLSYVMSIVT